MNKSNRKITNIPSGKKYVPGIVISGQQIQEAGFEYNTPVKVEYHKGIITINKIYNNEEN